MALTKVHGPLKKSASANREGERKYEVTYLVEMNSTDDGPVSAVDALTGSETSKGALDVTIGTTSYSIGNDADSFALLTQAYKAEKHTAPNEKGYFWKVTLYWETVSREGSDRDPTDPVQNPINDPVKISGTFSKGTRKTCKNASNTTITNISWDPVYVDKDETRPTVRIEKNVSTLPLTTINSLINNVNSVPMWGLAARKVKFSSASWTKKYWGLTTYYTLVYEFEVNNDTFDRSDVPDRNNKHIRGKFSPDGTTFTPDPGMSASNPLDFEPWINHRGRYKEGWLNTITGQPSNTESYIDTIQLYDATDLETNLGLPSSL